jgi:hypothetical protein
MRFTGTGPPHKIVSLRLAMKLSGFLQPTLASRISLICLLLLETIKAFPPTVREKAIEVMARAACVKNEGSPYL